MNESHPTVTSCTPCACRWPVGAMVILVVLGSVGFAAWTHFRTAEPRREPVLVVLDESVGVLLPPGVGFWEYETAWMPEVQDIHRAEKALSAFLRAKAPRLADRLGQYVRQYGGVVEEGNRVIFCSFLHESAFRNEDPRELLGRLSAGVTVFDGGDSFFQLFYDPETDTCSRLNVNGEA